MNFERKFLNDIPFRKFKRALGRDDALEYVHRLWAKCEAGKSECIALTDVEDIAMLMEAPDDLEPQTVLAALTKSGLLVEIEPLIYESVIWAKYNAGLIARWKNGRKGGSLS